MPTPPEPLHVVVAGGGPAAAELLLALRAYAEDRVSLELIAPSRELRIRAASPGAAYGAGREERYDLAELAADAGASFRLDALDRVSPRAHRLRYASGATTDYDALALALGARARARVPGALVFRDGRDAHHIAALRGDLRSGAARRVVFAAPTGATWTLPLYELALLTAAEAAAAGVDADITLATPERAPLEIFGADASYVVSRLLRDAGVRFVGDVAARAVLRDSLELDRGDALRADRVVVVPRLQGREIPGVPGDWSGFLLTDEHGEVRGRPDVFAAGDMTSYPVKQGGLATQQADAAARVIAARAGADVDPAPVRRVLRTRLLGAPSPVFLRAELDHLGRPLAAPSEPAVASEAAWWPAAKVFGRHLSPWMAGRHRAEVGARLIAP